jgi:hypothetical protein
MSLPPFSFQRHSILPAIGLFCIAAGTARAESLREQIDLRIEEKARSLQVSLAPVGEDAEFLRRLWLDLVGTIPSAREARQFLEDPSPGKRAALIERLLADPRYPVRMAEAFHVQLMERSGEDEGWMKYLTAAFEENKPWNAMAKEILAPDFQHETKRSAGFFITRRLEKVGSQQTDYPGLTRDVGRLFMGVDLQCCQCHKHPSVADYKQQEFNGLFVAYQNIKLNEPAGATKIKWFSEGLVTEKYEFTSVLSGIKGATGPRVPFGREFSIPELPEAERWQVAPDKKTKQGGIPKFSPVSSLAEGIASAENPYFAKNIANRLWWQFMGRGLVEPLDLVHSDNPASHPELLEELSEALVKQGFDLKWLVRELVHTRTYQRSGRLGAMKEAPAEDTFAMAMERPVSAEQFARAFLEATGEFERVALARGWEGLPEKPLVWKTVKASFTNAFANAPKEPELRANPSLRGALFMRNNETVLWALKARTGNLLERLSALPSAQAVAEELYLSVFTRKPAPEETQLLAAHLARAGDKTQATAEFLWAMLASTEFFTNH